MTTNIFRLITAKPSNKKGFGTFVKFLTDINKSGENYFGSRIFLDRGILPINNSLFTDYDLGLTHYLGDSTLDDHLSNSKDLVPCIKFNLGTKL